jgi:hypothetical protein
VGPNQTIKRGQIKLTEALGPHVEKIIIDELYNELLQDYAIKGQAKEWAQGVCNVHLKDFFAGMKAARVGTAHIGEYVDETTTRRSRKEHNQS